MGRHADPRAYLHASTNGRMAELRLYTDRASVLAATGWEMPPDCDAALVIFEQGRPLAYAGTREQIADVLSRWQVALLRPAPTE